MKLRIETLKEPDGASHLAAIPFKGSRAFAVSYGTLISVFSTDGHLLGSLHCPAHILAIIPRDDKYILLSCSSCFLAQDTAIIASSKLDIQFGLIHKVLAFGEYLVIVHDNSYSTARFDSTSITLRTLIDDAPFFFCLSATMSSPLFSISEARHAPTSGIEGPVSYPKSQGTSAPADCTQQMQAVFILAITLKNVYLIEYALDGVAGLMCTRKEIPSGSILFSYDNRLFIVDVTGIWEYKKKMVFVRELSAARISFIIEEGSRAVLFAEDGEVIIVSGDDCKICCIRTIGFAVTSASRINGRIMACSSRGMHIFSDSFEILSTIPSFVTLPHTSRVLDDGTLECCTSNGLMRLKLHIKTVPIIGTDSISGLLLRKPAYDTDIPHMAWKSSQLCILTFQFYSIINGLSIERIYFCHVDGPVTIFASKNNLFIYGDKLTVIPVKSTIAKCVRSHIYLYHYNTLHIITVANKPHIASLPVPTDICDFVFSDRELVLIHSEDGRYSLADLPDKDLMKPATKSTFETILEYVDRYPLAGQEADQPPQNIACFESVFGMLSGNVLIMPVESEYTCINGKVCKYTEGRLTELYDAGEHIRHVLFIGSPPTHLLISCMTKSVLYHDASGMIQEFDVPSFSAVLIGQPTDISTSDILLFTPAGPRRSTSLLPSVSYNILDLPSGSRRGGRIIYQDSDFNFIRMSYSMDMRGFTFHSSYSKLKFSNTAFLQATTICQHLLAVGIYEQSTKETQMLVVTIENGIARIEKRFKLADLLLSLCSFYPLVAAITRTQIVLFAITKGILRQVDEMACHNDLIADSYFMNANALVMVSTDSTFQVIKVLDSRKSKSVPDNLANQSGDTCTISSEMHGVADDFARTQENTKTLDSVRIKLDRGKRRFFYSDKIKPFTINGNTGFIAKSQITWCGSTIPFHESIIDTHLNGDRLVILGQNGSISSLSVVDDDSE